MRAAMFHTIISAYLAVVIALFPIVNPLGMAPIFLRLTGGLTDNVRAALASRIALGGLALMLSSMFAGSLILAFFGLTVSAVQVAGGLVVINAGWKMLNEGEDTGARARRSRLSDEAVLNRSFFPLTMPLTVGPGAISVAITLGSKASNEGGTLWAMTLGAVLGVATVAMGIYLSFRYAEAVLGRMGAVGTDVLMRLSAFILLCLGVQIVWNGAAPLWQGH